MMTKNVKRTLGFASALLMGLGVQAASASAATVPTEGDNCGTNGSGVYNCMYIQGVGDSIAEMRGWSRIPANGPWGNNQTVHEEISGPNGAAVCNSATVQPNSSGTQIVDCQVGPGNYAAGGYCSILWDFIPYSNPIHPGGYIKAAENCVTVP